jgi:peptidoglycan/LPS O-acetylase OafA/YrhL
MAALDKGYVLNIPCLRNILLWVGNRSYSIYVFQFFYISITIFIAQHIGMPLEHKVRLTAIYVAVLVVCSELIYHLWEKPLRNKGRKIAKSIVGSGNEA